jgi:hypothetical protein
MSAIEPYLVEMIGQLVLMRVPISSRQGLVLTNSIISGTAHEEKVLPWKENHAFRRNLDDKPMVLSKGNWAGFMKRNKHLVKLEALLQSLNLPGLTNLAIFWSIKVMHLDCHKSIT